MRNYNLLITSSLQVLCGHYFTFRFDFMIILSQCLTFSGFNVTKIIIDLGLKIRITCVNNNIVCFTSVICSSLYYNNFKTLRFYNWQFLYLLLCLLCYNFKQTLSSSNTEKSVNYSLAVRLIGNTLR